LKTQDVAEKNGLSIHPLRVIGDKLEQEIAYQRVVSEEDENPDIELKEANISIDPYPRIEKVPYDQPTSDQPQIGNSQPEKPILTVQPKPRTLPKIKLGHEKKTPAVRGLPPAGPFEHFIR